MKKLLRRNLSGFTLVELLIVVLIIGILASIAVPAYNRAVDKARYTKLMPVAKAAADAEEIFYISNGSYTETFQDLSVDFPATMQESIATLEKGTRMVLNANSTHQNVRATKDDLNSRYVVYFDFSPNFPGDVHCEALTKNARAMHLCKAMGGTELGVSGSYTTFLLEGRGMGSLVAVPKKIISSDGECQRQTGSNIKTCSRTVYEDGSYMEHKTTTGSGARYSDTEYLYDADGNLIRTVSKDYWGYMSYAEYDPITGKQIESVSYDYDHKKDWMTTEDIGSWSGYDEDGNAISVVEYGSDWTVRTDDFYAEYYKESASWSKDPYTGESLANGLHVRDYNTGEEIRFDADGNIVSYVTSTSTPVGEGWYDEYEDQWYYEYYQTDEYVYDKDGNMLGYSSSNDETGDSSSYTYYPDGSIRSASQSSNCGEDSGTYYYDQQGNLSKYTNAYGDTSYSFYENGTPKEVTADYGETTYKYYENGNLSYYSGYDSTSGDYVSVYLNQDGSVDNSRGYGGSNIDISSLPSSDSWANSVNTDVSWDAKPDVQVDTSTWPTRSDYPETYPLPESFCSKFPEDERCL